MKNIRVNGEIHAMKIKSKQHTIHWFCTKLFNIHLLDLTTKFRRIFANIVGIQKLTLFGL